MFPVFLLLICVSVANLIIHFVQFGIHSTLGLAQYLVFVCCLVYYKRNIPMHILSYDSIYYGSVICFLFAALNSICLLDIMDGSPLAIPLITDCLITTVRDMVVTVSECVGRGDLSPVSKSPGPPVYSLKEAWFIGMSGLSASLAGTISVEHVISRTGNAKAIAPWAIGLYTFTTIGFGLWGCESGRYIVDASYKEVTDTLSPPQVTLPSRKPVLAPTWE